MSAMITRVVCNDERDCKYEPAHLHGLLCDRECPCGRGAMRREKLPAAPVPAARHMGLLPTQKRARLLARALRALRILR